MNYGFIILAYTALIALSLIDNGRGAAYPEILEHFKISTDIGSYLFSLVSLSGLIVNITARKWLPLIGLVWATRLTLVFMGIGSYGMAVGAEMLSYPVTLSFAILAGLGLGGLAITMNVMVSEGAPLIHRRRFLSGLHGVYGVSSFFAPQILNIIINFGNSWPSYFKYISFVSLAVLIYSFFVEDTHKEHAKKTSSHYPIKKSKRIIIGLYLGLYVASEILVSSRLPLYLTRAYGMELVDANTYLSYFFISLMTGRLLFAFLNFKHDNYKLIITAFVLTLMTFSVGIFIHPLGLSITGLTMSYIFPVSMDWLNEKFHKYNHIMVASVMTTIGITLSTMHWGFGIITDMVGVKTAFMCFYIFKLTSFILFIVSDKFESDLK